jgi:Leucine-rich repeat (LRR) protein
MYYSFSHATVAAFAALLPLISAQAVSTQVTTTSLAQDCAIVAETFKAMGGNISINSANCCGNNLVTCSPVAQTITQTNEQSQPTTVAAVPFANNLGPAAINNARCSIAAGSPCYIIFKTSAAGTAAVNGAPFAFICDPARKVCVVQSQNQVQTQVQTQVQRVTRLDWAGKNLKGPVPGSLGSLGELKELILHNNQITSIPESLTNLRAPVK